MFMDIFVVKCPDETYLVYSQLMKQGCIHQVSFLFSKKNDPSMQIYGFFCVDDPK